MKIHYITVDHGDGSTGVRWFKDEHVQWLKEALDNDDHLEELYGNEGIYHTITLPDDLDLSTTGIYFFNPSDD